jgi:glycosyltransferase involved in cell wall biosynthesis
MVEAKVTVAILTRNRSPLLRLALQSVLAQRGVALDVLVLDNASSDNTRDVVRSFADERITYIRNESDIGIVRNWNRGIELAARRAPFVSIFHDDDIMLGGFLAESVAALQAYPSAGMSLCLAQLTHHDGSLKETQRAADVRPGLNRGLDFLELFVEGRCIEIPPPIALFRSDVLRQAGPADSPHARGTIDMNLYYRVAARADVVFIPKALVQYRIHDGSDTELLNRTAGGTFWYGTMAERIDAIGYLFRSPRAADPRYRQWLAERLLTAHAHQSTAIHPSVPLMYHTWDNRRAILLEQLDLVLPARERFVLIDDGQLGLGNDFEGRPVLPFLQRDGLYWGPPASSEEAIQNLEALRSAVVHKLVIAWPSFWWLDQYGRFDAHLREMCRCVFACPHGKVFDLLERL